MSSPCGVWGDCTANPLRPDGGRAFAWMSCHSRGGVKGSSRTSTLSERSALETAFAIAPPTGMMPPSPAPLAPSGLFGEGCCFERDRADHGIIGRDRDQVIRERGRQQLPVRIVGDLLAEHAAQALHRGADHLAVQCHRVDDAADIVDHDIVDDLDMAGLGIDRDMGDRGAVGVGRLGIVRERAVGLEPDADRSAPRGGRRARSRGLRRS